MKRSILSPSAFVQAAIALSTLLFHGCADETTGPTIPATFTSIQENIFEKNCTTSSCHSTLGMRGGLALEGENVYDHLVGASPTNTAALARGLKLVVPGKPDSSFLLIKLTGPGAGEGERMPYSNSSLSSEQIQAVRTWIANGAKRD